MSILRAGFIAVALKIQEAATAMCHEDIRTRLSDALHDAKRGTGAWCYVVAVFGDDKSGDVVYSCEGDLKKASYAINGGNCTIDTATAVDVQPLTTYEVESTLTEAGARNSKRDMVQLQTIHDSAAALGANCSMQEAHRTAAATGGALKLTESAATTEAIVLREARSDYEIKLIAPGMGSSAFYPAEVLKRDGPNVFKKGTHVYLNHPTATEEAQRPEGDVANLAGVLTTDAVYHESHAKGAGLYGRMKVFADHAATVEEKAPHVGMSIRAAGDCLMEAGRRVTKEGRPVLASLVSAESVDVVTRAGAGGMILTEAARGANPQQEASTMDAAELTKLQEAIAAATASNAKLLERAIRGDARDFADRAMRDIALKPESKARIIDSLMERALPVKEGALDETEFGKLVLAEAQREARYVAALTGAGNVVGMGAAPSIDPVKAAEARTYAEAESKRLRETSVNVFGRLMGNKAAAQHAADYKGVA